MSRKTPRLSAKQRRTKASRLALLLNPPDLNRLVDEVVAIVKAAEVNREQRLFDKFRDDPYRGRRRRSAALAVWNNRQKTMAEPEKGATYNQIYAGLQQKHPGLSQQRMDRAIQEARDRDRIHREKVSLVWLGAATVTMVWRYGGDGGLDREPLDFDSVRIEHIEAKIIHTVAADSVIAMTPDALAGFSSTDTRDKFKYDVFISHASEDKPGVVVPLTDELTKRVLLPISWCPEVII